MSLQAAASLSHAEASDPDSPFTHYLLFKLDVMQGKASQGRRLQSTSLVGLTCTILCHENTYRINHRVNHCMPLLCLSTLLSG